MTKNELINILSEVVMQDENPIDGVLYHAFNTVYQKSREGGYNPIEEGLLLNSAILNGLYNFPFERFSELSGEIGTFNMVQITDGVLKNNESAVYYKELYKQFLVEQRSVNKAMTNFSDAIGLVAAQFDPKVLQEQAEEIGRKLDSLGLLKEENKTN